MTKINNQQVIDALREAKGVNTKAAEALGVNESTIRRARRRIGVALNAENLDLFSDIPDSPLDEAPANEAMFEEPQGRVVKTTTHINQAGIKQVWERRVPDYTLTAIKAAKEAISEIKPLDITPALSFFPKQSQLCNLYPIADAHIGMLAWGKEGGADWDCKIAASVIGRAVDDMMARAAPAYKGMVVFLGDWLHFDGLEAVTPTSKHIVDADSRYPKVVKLAIKLAIYTIRRALQSHDIVEVLVAEGNHDLSGTVWLPEVLRQAFADEPRVSLVDSPKPYYAMTFGEVFLGFHHGHLKGVTKAAELISYFAQDFRQQWGQCSKHYIHTGHKHFLQVDGSRGAIIQQHMTLAARDAYASRYGYLGYRGIQSITYHKTFGHSSSVITTPEMLEHE